MELNKYITFQWGKYTSTSNCGIASVTFPITFKKILNAYNCVNNITESKTCDYNYSYVYGLSTTGMTVGFDHKGSNWFAVGT